MYFVREGFAVDGTAFYRLGSRVDGATCQQGVEVWGGAGSKLEAARLRAEEGWKEVLHVRRSPAVFQRRLFFDVLISHKAELQLAVW